MSSYANGRPKVIQDMAGHWGHVGIGRDAIDALAKEPVVFRRRPKKNWRRGDRDETELLTAEELWMLPPDEQTELREARKKHLEGQAMSDARAIALTVFAGLVVAVVLPIILFAMTGEP